MPDHPFPNAKRWNELFNLLCERAGLVDNNAIASRYCELANNGRGQRDFETTLRNLNNWRSGRHVPRYRSLRILEQLLGVDADPALSEQWHALYRQAREAEEGDDNQARTSAASGSAARGFSLRNMLGWRPAIAGTALFGLGLGCGMLLESGWRPWGGPAANAPLIAYTPEIEMTVGESRVIHAERGDCGKLPRDWPLVAAALPAAYTGEFSDGGLARRNSKFCGGDTPARAIIFTAKRPGTEEFLIQGDFFRVSVTGADASAEDMEEAG